MYVFDRDPLHGRGLQAISRMREELGKSELKVTFMRLDLGSFESTKEFTKEFQRNYSHLNILVNNAGVAMISFSESNSSQ